MTLCLIGMSMIHVSASSPHVIYQVEWVAQDAGIVRLEWNNETITTPIMIQGWSQNASGEIILRYRTGEEMPTGFDTRRIQVENLQAPFPIVLMDGSSSEHEEVFSDMPQGEEGKKAIRMLYDLGVLNGYTDGTIKPDTSVSRAEFSKMLFMATSMTNVGGEMTKGFSDVPTTHWASPYIKTLAVKGIVQGKGQNTFDPNGTITIGELATILNRTFTLYTQEKVYPYANTGHWSFPHFEALVTHEIIQATDAYYYPYRPDRLATRQDCAILLGRILLQYHEIVQ